MNERVEQHNLSTDHVMIQSELKYLIGGKVVMLKCQVFGGKTCPFPVGRVFCVVRTVATVGFQVKLEPEPTWEVGPVANTTPSISASQTHLCTINQMSQTWCTRNLVPGRPGIEFLWPGTWPSIG